MVTTELVTLSLCIGFILIIAGLFLKGKAAYLTLFGGVLFIVTGIVLLSSPLEFATGTETIVNGTTYTTNVTYSSQNEGINTVMAFVVLFLGLISTFLSVDYLYNHNRYDEED